MTVPVASKLRRAFPEMHLVWAVEKRCAAVVDQESLVTIRHEAPRNEWRKRRMSPATWADQLRYYLSLRKQHFDFGIDLQGHSKTALCLRLSGAKKRLAVKATDALSRRLNPVWVAPVTKMHHVERNLACLESLFPCTSDAAPIMPTLQFERSNIRERISEKASLVTIMSSAGQPDKAWPIERWNAVAENLIAAGKTVAFLGGPGDPRPGVQGALDWVGQLPLEETMAAIAESELHLSGDTGGGHIAAAYSIPQLSIFGPTDPEVFRPYSQSGVVLRRERSTENISIEEVWDAAQRQLEQHGKTLSH